MKNSPASILRLCFIAFCVSSCQSIPTVVGDLRPVTDPAQVQIYGTPPSVYKEIGMVEATPSRMLHPGKRYRFRTAMQDLKTQAASLGANGIIVAGLKDYQQSKIAEGYGVSGAYGSMEKKLFPSRSPYSAIAIHVDR